MNMRNNILSLEQLHHYQTFPPVQIWQISLFNDLVWLFLWLDKSVTLQNLQIVKLYKFFITKFLFYFSFCICSQLGNGWQLLSYSPLSRVARGSTSIVSSKKIFGEEGTEAQLLLLLFQHLPRQLQLPPLQQLLLPQPRHWWLSWLPKWWVFISLIKYFIIIVNYISATFSTCSTFWREQSGWFRTLELLF